MPKPPSDEEENQRLTQDIESLRPQNKRLQDALTNSEMGDSYLEEAYLKEIKGLKEALEVAEKANELWSIGILHARERLAECDGGNVRLALASLPDADEIFKVCNSLSPG